MKETDREILKIMVEWLIKPLDNTIHCGVRYIKNYKKRI